MHLFGVILGTAAQLMLALFIFILVAFAGGGYASGGASSRLIGFLDFCLYAIPMSCLVCAGIVIFGYIQGYSSQTYWWYVTPIVFTAVCFFVAKQTN